MVKVIEVDKSGKIRLSRKELLESEGQGETPASGPGHEAPTER